MDKNKKAHKKFGDHLKIIEVLTPSTHPMQVERTSRMNGHGRRFQNSIDMVELRGLNLPTGTTKFKASKITIRELILQHKTSEGKIVFLSVTKKWGSSAWQATFIKKEKKCN